MTREGQAISNSPELGNELQAFVLEANLIKQFKP